MIEKEQAASKAFLSFRIGSPQWLGEDTFASLKQFFAGLKGVAQEVAFLTSETHAPLPLETVAERTEILKLRMVEFRKLGFRSGINVLCTIGHHDENFLYSLKGEYTRATGPDGAVLDGVFCWNDQRYLKEYVAELYIMMAAANPDFIWVDDDIRSYHGCPKGSLRCFCDNCITLFNRKFSCDYTRESLNDALYKTDVKTGLGVWHYWNQFKEESIENLLSVIEKTVHAIRPGLPLGYMSGEIGDYAGRFLALSGKDKAEVLWRPGGGLYNDDVPGAVFFKAHSIGRQVAMLPREARSIQSEIENFPYERLRKSEHMTVLESAAYIAAGCTGAAFNVLSMYPEPLDEYRSLARTIKKAVPFLDLLAAEFDRAEPVGVGLAWSSEVIPQLQAEVSEELWEIGIPMAYSRKNSNVMVIVGNRVHCYSYRELEVILSGGAYLDAPALDILNNMGFGELTGFKTGEVFWKDSIEKLLVHELNGAFAGRIRDCRQSWRAEPCFSLTPTNEKSEPLSSFIDYNFSEKAACGSGVFENRLGGRICVSGHFPLERLKNLSKSTQLKSVMRWLSKDSLPCYVNSFHRANVWVRKTKGRLKIFIVNASLDPARNVELMVKTASHEAVFYDSNCRAKTLVLKKSEGPYQSILLPQLKTWGAYLVVV